MEQCFIIGLRNWGYFLGAAKITKTSSYVVSVNTLSAEAISFRGDAFEDWRRIFDKVELSIDVTENACKLGKNSARIFPSFFFLSFPTRFFFFFSFSKFSSRFLLMARSCIIPNDLPKVQPSRAATFQERLTAVSWNGLVHRECLVNP